MAARMTMFRRIACGCGVLALAAGACFGNMLESKKVDFGIGVGSWFGGKVSVSGYDQKLDKDPSPMVRGYVDAYVIPNLGLGGYFNVSGTTMKRKYETYYGSYTRDYDTTMSEFGFSIKPRFFAGERVAIKPGLGIGYRIMNVRDNYNDKELDTVEGLAVNPSCEVQVMVGRILLFGEIGALSQPAGGNEDYDITFSPIVYLTTGVGF